jgi:hypothetical protein
MTGRALPASDINIVPLKRWYKEFLGKRVKQDAGNGGNLNSRDIISLCESLTS